MTTVNIITEESDIIRVIETGPQGPRMTLNDTSNAFINAATYEEKRVLLDVLSGNSSILKVETIADLKNINTTSYTSNAVFVRDEYKFGIFHLLTGNYSTESATDTMEGIYVVPNDSSANTKIWKRNYIGLADAQWFGAIPDDNTDASAAFNCALNVATKITASGDYRFSSPILLSGRKSILAPNAKLTNKSSGNSLFLMNGWFSGQIDLRRIDNDSGSGNIAYATGVTRTCKWRVEEVFAYEPNSSYFSSNGTGSMYGSEIHIPYYLSGSYSGNIIAAAPMINWIVDDISFVGNKVFGQYCYGGNTNPIVKIECTSNSVFNTGNLIDINVAELADGGGVHVAGMARSQIIVHSYDNSTLNDDVVKLYSSGNGNRCLGIDVLVSRSTGNVDANVYDVNIVNAYDTRILYAPLNSVRPALINNNNMYGTLIYDSSVWSANVFNESTRTATRINRIVDNRPGSTITISSGVGVLNEPNASMIWRKFDTEGAASSDDLTSITGGFVGQIVVCNILTGTRPVTLKHSGSLILENSCDKTIASVSDFVILICTATNVWRQIGSSFSTPISHEFYADEFSGSDYGAQINAAINAATAVGGGTVWVKSNNISTAITPKANVTLKGLNGSNGTILKMSASVTYMIAASVCDNFAIKDLTLDGNNYCTTAALRIVGLTNSQIDNCRLINTGESNTTTAIGISIGYSTTQNNKITNCEIIGFSAGISTSGGMSNFTVKNNKFRGYYTRGLYVGNSNGDNHTFIVEDNVFYAPGIASTKQPVAWQITGSYRHYDVIFRGNKAFLDDVPYISSDPTINNGTADCFSFHGIIRGLMEANYVFGSGEVGINLSYGCEDCVVKGNYSFSCDTTGFNIGTGTVCKNITVIDNVAKNCSRDQNGDHVNIGGICISNTENVVVAFNDVDTNITGNTQQMPYGIVYSNNRGVIDKNNNLRNYSTSRRYVSNTTFKEVQGHWDSEPTMDTISVRGSEIYDATANKKKMWSGSSFVIQDIPNRWYARVASTGAIQSSNNVSSCVCAQTGIYMYTFSTPLPDTEYVVNVMTSNELAERGSEVIITSNNTMNVYIFTSGATRANLAHSFEIWR